MVRMVQKQNKVDRSNELAFMLLESKVERVTYPPLRLRPLYE